LDIWIASLAAWHLDRVLKLHATAIRGVWLSCLLLLLAMLMEFAMWATVRFASDSTYIRFIFGKPLDVRPSCLYWLQWTSQIDVGWRSL